MTAAPVTRSVFDTEMKRINDRFEAVDKRFDALEEKLEATELRLEEKLAATEHSLEAKLDSKLAATEKRLSWEIAHAINAGIETITARLAPLSDKDRQLETELARLRRDFEEHRDDDSRHRR